MISQRTSRHPLTYNLYAYFFWCIRAILHIWNKFLVKTGIKLPPAAPVVKPTIIDLNNQYIEKMTSLFLNGGKWEKNPNKNANIDADVYDLKQLESILSDENNELEKQWSRRVLVENTPRGNIVMVYDIFNQRFNYYSDTIIPYKMLNAIAMKYVSIYQCRDFFIDEWVLDTPSPLANMCYVRPKRYDKRPSTNTNKPEKINGLNNVRASKDTRKTNMFSHKGKFCEYGAFTKTGIKRNQEENVAKLSFSKFKQLGDIGMQLGMRNRPGYERSMSSDDGDARKQILLDNIRRKSRIIQEMKGDDISISSTSSACSGCCKEISSDNIKIEPEADEIDSINTDELDIDLLADLSFSNLEQLRQTRQN